MTAESTPLVDHAGINTACPQSKASAVSSPGACKPSRIAQLHFTSKFHLRTTKNAGKFCNEMPVVHSDFLRTFLHLGDLGTWFPRNYARAKKVQGVFMFRKLFWSVCSSSLWTFGTNELRFSFRGCWGCPASCCPMLTVTVTWWTSSEMLAGIAVVRGARCPALAKDFTGLILNVGMQNAVWSCFGVTVFAQTGTP